MNRSKSLNNLSNSHNCELKKTFSQLNLLYSQEFDIVELGDYIGTDKQLKKNIISSCDMYCGKYYIHMKETIKKYFKKKGNKDIYIAVKNNNISGINKIYNILGYCIITYRKDHNRYLINITRNNKSLGYRYVNQKKAQELIDDQYKNLKSELNIAHLNVICALTPDIIPILPEYKFKFSKIFKSIKDCVIYNINLNRYKKIRKYYQYQERISKMPRLGTKFLERVLLILKNKNIDVVKLSSLNLNNRDTRNRFYSRHGFKYSLNYYNHQIKDYQYCNMILDLNQVGLLSG
jgi:hypothetical protein